MTPRISSSLLTTLAIAACVAVAATAANGSASSTIWKKLLLTPAQAELLQEGSGFHYYDRPIAYKHGAYIGGDHSCPTSRVDYNETIEGNLPGGADTPEDLIVAVDYFASSTAAHRTFRCLSRQTYNLSNNHYYDLTNLERRIGNESFGGGGDDNPIGVVRQGRYVIWIEIQNGFGPIGNLMQAEVTLVRRFG